ncbi:hypothetical protein SprV_0501926500 [Sparganum proliferum]
MGLFGHMRIRESGIDRLLDSPTTPSPTLTSSPCAPTTFSATDTDTTDFTCPHCPRPFTSRISLVGYLRIHRIAQRLANQGLEHQPTPTTLDSTAHTALALPRIAWAHSATYASTNTCGRQSPDVPHHHTLPPSLTTISPHISTHPPQVSNCHLPRKWEVCISTRSPCGFCFTGDLSLRPFRHVQHRG